MKFDTEILCSFIDGELDAQTAQAVRAALETDKNLRREYEDLLKTVQLVRGLPRVSAPPELAEAVTANAQREQLLGPTPTTSPAKGRHRLYWGLSVAASLLIGAAVGILSYHTWQGQPTPADVPTGPHLVMMEEDIDSPQEFYAGKAPRPALPGSALVINGRGGSGKAGEEIVAATKADLGGTLARTKGGARIARTGPKKGVSTISIGQADRIPGDGPLVADRAAKEAPQTGMVVAVEKSSRQEQLARAGEDQQVLAYDSIYEGSLETRGAPAGGVTAADTEAYYRLKAVRKILPLEPQIRANNFVNQEMVANQRFEIEPLNIRVISNDTAKTLQYVQRWAESNSLIDLNKASAKVNFPAYTQVVYQGQPDTNIKSSVGNGVLLRITRSQAQQIVTELQQQKPLVASVSLKDDKNFLGYAAGQFEIREELGEVATHRAVVGKAGPGLAKQPAPEPSQIKLDAEMEKKDTVGQKADKYSPLKDQQAQLASIPTAKPKADYLFQITNQARVQSLDDLVTLVILVEDAKPAEQNQTQTRQDVPESTESK